MDFWQTCTSLVGETSDGWDGCMQKPFSSKDCECWERVQFLCCKMKLARQHVLVMIVGTAH